MITINVRSGSSYSGFSRILLPALFICFFHPYLYCTPSNVSANRTSSFENEVDGERSVLTDLLTKSRTILYQNPGEAKITAWKGLKQAELLEDTKMQAAFSNLLGIIYDIQVKIDSAADFYQTAYKLYATTEDYAGMVKVLNNLGVIKHRQGQYSEALKDYEASLNLARSRNDSVNATICLNNIATIYSERSDFTKALSFNSESLKITEKIGDIYGVGYSCFNLGQTYFRMNRFEESNNYMQRALVVFLKASDRMNTAKTLESIARINLKTGSLDMANEHLNEAVKIAKVLNSQELLRDCYFGKSLLDSIKGDYLAAFDSYKLYKAYNDSFFSLEKNRQMAEINARFDLENKQQQLELLEKKNLISQMSLSEKSFTIYVLFAGLLLIAALSVLGILYLKLRSKRKITELTLRNMRQQMNPHFIFNVMNSVYYSLQNNDKQTSFRYLNMLSKLMRKTLENSQFNAISIADEVDSLRLYLELEALRLKHKFTFSIDIDDSIDQDQYKIPTLLLQPFVENSIRHGISPKEGKGKVNIDLSLKGKYLQCIITDNGVGRHASGRLKTTNGSDQHHSLGLAITDNRLRLINSVYGKNLSVRFTDLKNDSNSAAGTSVEIELKDAINKVVNALPTNFRQFDQVLFENYYRQHPSKLAVTVNNGYEYIELDEIIRFEADRSYCSLFLKGGKKLLVSKCLNEFYKLLQGKNFYRVHNSHLINLHHVIKFVRTDGGFVKLSDGSTAPMSRNKKDEFLVMMKEFALF